MPGKSVSKSDRTTKTWRTDSSVAKEIPNREVTTVLRSVFLADREIEECLADVVLTLDLLFCDSCAGDTEKPSLADLEEELSPRARLIAEPSYRSPKLLC